MGYAGPIPCMDCGVETFQPPNREWYHVYNEVWESAEVSVNGGTFLCIGCLETRLGRNLTPGDFDGYEPHPGDSPRLRDRRR